MTSYRTAGDPGDPDDLGCLSNDDLRERAELLNEAQQLYEDLAYISVPKIPCPECSGAGQVFGGSLGNMCPRCLGTRVVDRPGGVPLELPDFASIRARITAYGDALADRALPEGHRAKKLLALPPMSSVPTIEEIQAIHDSGHDRAKELQNQEVEIDGVLAEPKKAQGLLSESGELDDFGDAELDEMEP
jgi:hypothetical protein